MVVHQQQVLLQQLFLLEHKQFTTDQNLTQVQVILMGGGKLKHQIGQKLM
jgi:hypothetical protein